MRSQAFRSIRVLEVLEYVTGRTVGGTTVTQRRADYPVFLLRAILGEGHTPRW